MHRFSSPFGTITLTDERWRHIVAFHPDVTPCLRYFAQALGKPDMVIGSNHDSSVVICYRFLPQRKKYLTVVVKVGAAPFVLTAYLAKKPKPDIL
jgi:hypothetical protein